MRLGKVILAFGFMGCAALGVCGETHTVSCYSAAPNIAEPVGDRDGHAVQAATFACLESGGAFEGMVTNQTLVWEHDNSGSKLLGGEGVGRKQGALVVFRHTEGERARVLKDGQPAGWKITGKGVFTFATGSLSQLAGKTFSWIVKGGGPGRSISETTLDD